MNLLNSKVAVITGSTRGLGLAIAQAYAAEGAAVVIAGRSQPTVDAAAAALRANGARAAGLACDVGDLEQVEALAAFAVEAFGKMDVWVNNAGLSAPYGPTVDVPPPDFARVVNTNILGVYHGSLAALRHLLPQRSGKLINLLGRGDRRGVKYQNAYSASKVWIRAFTATLAAEHRGSGVDILAFNPGLVDTDMLRRVEVVPGFEERVKALEVVLRLWGNPPEVPAQTAVQLASSASDGKNGAVVSVLGPRRLLSGLLREGARRLLGRPAPDTSIAVRAVRPKQ